MRFIVLLLALAGALVGPARAGGPTTGVAETLTTPIQIDVPPELAPPDVATVDARTEELASRMRCPVCQGLSVADSKSEAALNMKQRIRELVEVGYSPRQIEGYFVTRYGEWIMLEPKAEGLNWIIFIAPVVAVLLGAGVIAMRLAGGSEETAAPADDAALENAVTVTAEAGPRPAAPREPHDAYRERILRELGDKASGGAGEGA